jgi:hypothetical protein
MRRSFDGWALVARGHREEGEDEGVDAGPLCIGLRLLVNDPAEDLAGVCSALAGREDIT